MLKVGAGNASRAALGMVLGIQGRPVAATDSGCCWLYTGRSCCGTRCFSYIVLLGLVVSAKPIPLRWVLSWPVLDHVGWDARHRKVSVIFPKNLGISGSGGFYIGTGGGYFLVEQGHAGQVVVFFGTQVAPSMKMEGGLSVFYINLTELASGGLEEGGGYFLAAKDHYGRVVVLSRKHKWSLLLEQKEGCRFYSCFGGFGGLFCCGSMQLSRKVLVVGLLVLVAMTERCTELSSLRDGFGSLMSKMLIDPGTGSGGFYGGLSLFES